MAAVLMVTAMAMVVAKEARDRRAQAAVAFSQPYIVNVNQTEGDNVKLTLTDRRRTLCTSFRRDRC